ncbi:DUF418 domain-containing protein [Streptomonospora sp. S1-112]|uniref:DUF418 domain-containing protein n=1 Tax=Streptomonospora mangrovi TaxID=2883123 RepID=A0A9X3SFZ6_9ACTN|nr:DUF418 domain-containing protein [Streptomonospora mangrovi]MDA0565410.1 DUF418 domain-containing protein [Streptomonospora mangrovi]
MNATTSPARGPVRPDERALAPDLARGFMLLMIALANTPWYLWGSPQSSMGAHPTDGSALDRAVQFVMITAVDGRIYPMFACLFGYGMMRLYDRQREAGASERSAAGVLRRRHLWLLVFGFLHTLLLFMGDILATYGLAGLILGWLLLRRSERAIRIAAGVLLGVVLLLYGLTLLGAVAAASAPPSAADAESTAGIPDILHASFGEPDILAAAVDRVIVWPLMLLVQVFGLTVPAMMALGMVLAKRRVLERPQDHLRLLTWTAVIGIGVAWVSGLPHAMAHVGLFDSSELLNTSLGGVQQLSGVFGGTGYVALFGLIGYAMTRRSRRGVVTTAVAAVGKRSLSCYLAQSVICAPLLTAWGVGLGGVFGSAQMAAFAVGVWLVTLVGAYAMERADVRSPAEVLLRRLSYRGRSRPGNDPAATAGAPAAAPAAPSGTDAFPASPTAPPAPPTPGPQPPADGPTAPPGR